MSASKYLNAMLILSVLSPGVLGAPKDKLFSIIPADKICNVLGLSLSPCAILGPVEKTLNAAGGSVTTCKTPPAGDQVLPPGTPQPLSDKRPLPSSFPLSEVAKEGSTYYWLYRMLLNLEGWSVCQASNPTAKLLVPSGWSLLSTVALPQGNSNPSSLKFTSILLNKQKTHIIILNRGTMTSFEWLLDFTYNQTSAVLPTLLQSPVHQGFGNVLNTIWTSTNGVKSILDKYVIKGNTVTHITIAGHSLGAGVSTLMSVATENYLKRHKKGNIVVDAVLFAPPNVGPPTFAAEFNSKINGRRVAFKYDIVPQVPCAPSMFACPGSLLSPYPIPTNMPGQVKSWSYAEVAGHVDITPAAMPADKDAWAKLKTVPLGANTVNFLMATHVCSYGCYFSQFADGGAQANSNCWLSEKPAVDAEGSYCQGFPDTNYP